MTLICASKYFNVDKIKDLYQKGVTNFGENRVNELLDKKDKLDDLNIKWHFIGHLQSNKVKKVINEIDYLHTLDSLKLANEIQKYRIEPLDTFIQLNLSEENQKYGINYNYLAEFLILLKKYDKINIIGLMAIGRENDFEITEDIFKKVNKLSIQFNLKFSSIGMSNDYELAIKHGATHIRIGRKIDEYISRC